MFLWERKALDWLSRNILILAAAAVSLLALYLRVMNLDYVSQDYRAFLEPWYNQLNEGGGLRALSQPIGNYNIPYLTILALLTYLPLEPLAAIKLVSILFDYLLAGAAAWAAYLLLERSQRARAGACGVFCGVLLLPSVFLNSAYWAQCDSIYTALLLLSLAALLRERPLAAVVWFAVSFCMKLQAIMFLPVLILVYLAWRRFSAVYFTAIPAIFLLGCVPAFIAGRGVWDSLTIYLRQADEYPSLTMNYPNLYYFLMGEYEWFSAAGVSIAVSLMILLAAFLLAQRRTIGPADLTGLSLWVMLVCLYVLPSMHERYGYPTDVLSLLYAVTHPRRWYVAVIINLSSMLSYTGFLFGYWVMDLTWWAIAKLGVLAVLTLDLLRLPPAPSSDLSSR